MKLLIISILAAFTLTGCNGTKNRKDGTVSVKETADYLDADVGIFKKYVTAVGEKKSEPIGNLIVETALFFKDSPYVAHTLEKEPEQLVVNLRELDCTTFLETVLALSRTIKRYPEPAFEDFCGELQKIRYRNGEIGDYTSRLHYFSDWIFENGRRGFVRDITESAGGKPYTVSVSFMSSHPESYKQLNHPAFLAAVAEREKEISSRKNYALITKDAIQFCEKGFRNGDIVCFVTDIEGLDISHVGFLYFENGILTFIHASSQYKKAIVNQKSLTDYVSGIKSNKGVMIVRPE